MTTYIVRRVLQMIPLLLLISLVIYALVALQPGDPVDQLLLNNPTATADDVARLKAAYGLDQPVYVRYFYWLRDAVQGDFGMSRQFFAPAAEYVFRERLPNTLWITIPALVISTVVAVPLGIYSALRQYTLPDYVLTFLSFIGFSTPVFWLGAMLLYLFAIVIPGWTGGAISLPPGGFGSPDLDPTTATWWQLFVDRLPYLVLPVFVLAFLEVATTTRFMRASMLEVLNQDFVRTARAKGLAGRLVVYKHALRNALIPVVTLLGLRMAGLFGGAVLTETVFNVPGMGRVILESLVSKDFNVAMAALTFLSLMTVVFTLVADLVYAVVDPRIRYT